MRNRLSKFGFAALGRSWALGVIALAAAPAFGQVVVTCNSQAGGAILPTAEVNAAYSVSCSATETGVPSATFTYSLVAGAMAHAVSLARCPSHAPPALE